jgi:hypothetical protein
VSFSRAVDVCPTAYVCLTLLKGEKSLTFTTPGLYRTTRAHVLLNNSSTLNVFLRTLRLILSNDTSVETDVSRAVGIGD